MKAIILAAGLGTRLRPITERFAKPAVPFLNVPLLCYPLTLMEQARITGLVLNTHHKPEQIESLATRICGRRLSVAFSHEAGAPLGSGGGIWKARKLLEGGGDFLVANGDEVILPREPDVMTRFLMKHRSTQALATILVMRHPLVGTQFGGVWADEVGRVKGFGKDGSKFGGGVTGFHYIGLLLLNDRVFDFLPEGESNILYDALAAGIAKGERVQIVESDFTWFETGNPKDFLSAAGEALELLFNGQGEDAACLRGICQRFWTPGTELREDGGRRILAAPSARVDSSAKLNGFCILGERVRVASGAELTNVVLLDDTVIPVGAKLADTIQF